MRTHLLETARPLLEAMIQEVTGIKVVSMHHDISTVTGEEVVLFTLAESPSFREAKKRSNRLKRERNDKNRLENLTSWSTRTRSSAFPEAIRGQEDPPERNRLAFLSPPRIP